MLIALSMALATPDLGHADELRIALVGVPARLEQAAVTSLSPWHITVLTLPGDPALDDGSLIQRGRELVASNRVQAVFWVGKRNDHYTLWFYDARNEHIESRAVPGEAPFNDAVAAAVALSIKTLLRNSELLPDIPDPGDPPGAGNEALMNGDAGAADGASSSSEQAGNPADVPAHDPVDAQGSGEEIPVEPTPAPTPAPASGPSHTLEFGAQGGVRLGLSNNSSTDPRLGLIAAWSPLHLFPRYSLEFELRLGPTTSVERSGLDGRFSDTAARIAVRRTLLGSSRGLALAASLGAAIHSTRIQGTLVDTMQPANVSRLNPAGFGRVRASIRIGARWLAAAHLTGTSLLQRQLYEVNGVSAYTVSRYSIEAGAGLGMLLDW